MQDPSILNNRFEVTDQNCILSLVHDANNKNDPQNAFLLLEKRGQNVGDRVFQYFELQISERGVATKIDEELSTEQFKQKMKGKDCYVLSDSISLDDANRLWGRLRQEEKRTDFRNGNSLGFFDRSNYTVDFLTSLAWSSEHFNARSPSLRQQDGFNYLELEPGDGQQRAANFKKIRRVVHQGDFSGKNNLWTQRALITIGIGCLAAPFISYAIKPEETARFFTDHAGNAQLPNYGTIILCLFGAAVIFGLAKHFSNKNSQVEEKPQSGSHPNI